MDKNSYVCIPADKLVELIKTTCPPGLCGVPSCGGYTGKDCVECWCSWLKDGDVSV